MAERVVKVKLTATMDQYVAAMDKAAKATRDVGTEGAKLAQTKQAFDMVGRSALVAGGLVAAGLGVAISKFVEFDAAISNVEAATRESAENMELLRDAALEAGATTVFSATESANAIEELGKAGLSTADILGGALDGSLSLAAAGGIGVAEAAGIAATALQQFELEGNQATHVADLLAAGAGKAMGDVGDLSAALNQVGLVANSTGLSIEETTASLAAFASKGLLGSDAGTSFKAMLQRLTPQSQEAADKMDELGISAYDAAGQFIGMEEFAGNLQDSLHALTDEQRNSALATIFGSDAVRAANVLYEEGAEGISDWTTAVDDAGYAAETAATKLDNLKGDWEALSGAVDTALIGMGEAADGPLRLFTQSITEMVDGFNLLPEGGKQAVTWIGAAGAAAALAGGAYLLAVPKIAAYNAALSRMGAGAQLAGRAVAGFAKGATLIAGLSLAANVLNRLASGADKAAPGLDRVVQLLSTGKIDGAFKNASEGANSFADALNLIEGQGFDAQMERIGETLGAIIGPTGQVTEAREGFIALDGALSQMVSSGSGDRAAKLFDELKDKAEAQGIPIAKLKALFPQYDNALAGVVSTTDNSAASFEAAAAEAEALNTQFEELLSRLNEMNDLNSDANTSNAAYQAALAGISDEVQRQKDEYEQLNGTLDGFALSLDRNTEAGSANEAMLTGVAAAARQAAEDQYDLDRQTMSVEDATDKYVTTLENQKKAFEDSATAAGFNADEVQGLSDKVIAVPSEKEIEFLVATGEAAKKIDQFIRTYNGKVITLQLTTNQVVVNDRVYGGLRDGRAAGGPIYGPGTGTSDTAGLFALSNGEHVWTAAEVQAAGGHGAVEDMRKWVRSGWQGYATGGAVGTSSGGGRAPVVINQEIHPTQGMSELQIGRAAAEQAAFALRGAN